MKKKDAMKWVNALRSGKYKQGKGELCNENGEMCCLGVLNHIFPKLKLAGGSNNILVNHGRIGLITDGGRLKNSSVYLCNLNDIGRDAGLAKPLTFDEIADVIQIEYVEGL